MKRKLTSSVLLATGFFIFCSFLSTPASAQNDTIKVMTYNTLGFGPGSCQAQGSALQVQDTMMLLYADLNAIFQFAKPDIIGLDKLQCIDTSATDNEGLSKYAFVDTIINECFDTSFSFCRFTDRSGCLDGASSVVFYNHRKMGYVSTTPLYVGQEDIDLFKLYYRDPYLPTTHDTTFLFVILCHTISGSASAGRDQQDTDVMHALRNMFVDAPNVIYMGDFNTRSSSEPGYAYITQNGVNPNFIFDDPPFHPDAALSYPLNWNSNPTACPSQLTTTTRSTTLPNSCGTTGGGKDWYDHIFLSPSIVNNLDFINYIKHSYTTIGNDGNRIGQSVNAGSNSSAPANVLNALFNFSDKYPVMVSLSIANNPTGITNILKEPGTIKVNNPIANNSIVLHFAPALNGQNITMTIYDICGRNIYTSEFVVNGSVTTKNIPLAPGVYMLHFTYNGYSTTLKVVKE